MNPNENNPNIQGQNSSNTQGTQVPLQGQNVAPVQQVSTPIQTPIQGPVQSPSTVQQPQSVPNNIPGPVMATNNSQQVNNIPQATSNQQVVNNDERRKSNPILVIILIAALILFVFNMEEVEGYYRKYILKENSSQPVTTQTTESNDMLKINETTNYNKVKNIKFYNFKKGDEENIIFTYESSEKINNPSTLDIFMEFYDANKTLIYKEQFISKDVIEKDTARNYNISLKNDLYNYYDNVYYVLVKTYTEEEKNSENTLTCKKETSLNTSKLEEIVKYNFKNNTLVGYEVNKKVVIEEVEGVEAESISDSNTTKLEKEYNEVSTFIKSANHDNYNLSYNVDLEYNIEGFIPLYKKGIVNNTLKKIEEDKEWKCE